MPCRYVINKEKRLVISSAWGRVTFAEVRAHQDSLRNDPDFDPEFNQLVDASEVTEVDATVEEVKRAASHHLFSPNARRAFVATRPEIFAVGRLLGAHLSMGRVPQQVNIFYDMPAALKWLGLDEDPRTS